MELVKRKIILSGLTISGNTIFPPNFIQPDLEIGIFLTQTFDDIGLYTDLEENLDISSKSGQLAKGGGKTTSGIGMYVLPYGNPFITINNINEPLLVSQILAGTELNISFNNIINTVIVTNIFGPNNNIMSYRLNNLIPGLNNFDQVNITVGQLNSVFLSEYVGTDNSGSGQIITTGTSKNFQLSDFLTNQSYIISGNTSSRLNEIKTFKLIDPFVINKPELGNKWVRNIGIEQNTNRTFIEYTITPVDYKTYLDNNETTYLIPSKFLPQNSLFYTPPILSGWNISNTSFLSLIKEESKMGLVETPKIISELFVNRREISVFENHLRLNEINGVIHLVEYQRKFYIINNE